jgi:23S rRNA pseudouridine955/2504/2580 synthase
MSAVQTIAVGPEEADIRLDRWFKRHFPELGHGRLEKLLRTGQVRVDGRRAQAGLRLAAGQQIRVPPLGEARPRPQPKPAPEPSERDLRALQDAILYRDEAVLAINKPAGLAVQGGTGLDRHLDAMLDGLRLGAAERPRLVHRLDRDTSGVLLLARTARAAAELTAAFRRKECRKIYWAIVVGVPRPPAGRIDLALSKRPGRGGERMELDEEGKHAITAYRVLDHAGREAAWLELSPLTGRTHQLRAHCAAIGTPILGDGKYGGAKAFLPGRELARRLHLHARSLTLPRPDGRVISITAPLPAHMAASWRFFGFNQPRGDAGQRPR